MNRTSHPSVPLFAAVAALLVLATVLVLSVPASAAGPAPITGTVSPGEPVPPALAGKVGEMPSDGAAGLNASAFTASNRTGLGLPSYKHLLGKGWKRKARKADRRFGIKLDASEAIPAGKQRRRVTQDEFDRNFKIKDAVKGKGGKQTRSLRVAATLDGGCPLPVEGGEGFGWTGTGRAVYEVTTTERVGKYDLLTAVVMDGSFHSRPGMLKSAEAEEFSSADYGEISITRNQVAVNRKTGKRRTVGETERYTSSLDPFYKPEGNFEAFIASQEDGAPAPERPLKTTDYTTLGGWFMLIPYDAMRSRVLDAAKLAQTPNKCVSMSFPAAPTHLAPGQAIKLTGVPKVTWNPAFTPFAVLQETSRIRADWINFQGQEATPLGKIHELWNGKPWFSFKAPAKAWPESKPVGLDFTLYSAAGVATAPVSFKPESPEVHYEILDASFSTDTDASRTTPLCEVGGSEQFDGTFHPTEFDPDDKLVVEDNGFISGEVVGLTDATWHDHHVFGCDMRLEGDDYCEKSFPATSPRPDGIEPISIGFSNAADPSMVKLWWSMRDPEVGFIDAGDDECNAHVWGHFENPVNTQTIPRAKLQETGPIPLTLAGSGHIDKHGGFWPASIDYTWEYKLTIQRVDAEGNPL